MGSQLVVWVWCRAVALAMMVGRWAVGVVVVTMLGASAWQLLWVAALA